MLILSFDEAQIIVDLIFDHSYIDRINSMPLRCSRERRRVLSNKLNSYISHIEAEQRAEKEQNQED